MDSENLEIDTGRFAVSCPIADCATTEQPYASAVEGSAPDRAAARIYGCREVDLVAIREAVDEPSRRTGAGAAELPARH